MASRFCYFELMSLQYFSCLDDGFMFGVVKTDKGAVISCILGELFRYVIVNAEIILILIDMDTGNVNRRTAVGISTGNGNVNANVLFSAADGICVACGSKLQLHLVSFAIATNERICRSPFALINIAFR